ncbi:MAG: sigma-70 family RNA polymerase sigma factor [Bryobacterales bacterium]|nr:sigma-70 family RNA polymerase sigma factor [Bryobacterales bacterium]
MHSSEHAGIGTPDRPAGHNRTDCASQPDWKDLVERIRNGQPSAMEDLYRVFSRGVRFFLYRQLGSQDLDDKVHDVFLIVVQAIRRGDLREPERLLGFIRTIVRRQVAAHIDHAVHDRRERTGLEAGGGICDLRADPEEAAMRRQRDEIMEKVLRSISRRDREILTRFYLMEQSQQEICRQMKLTETQFRLLKSRAKARFGEAGKRRLDLRRKFS